jgi:integrase
VVRIGHGAAVAAFEAWKRANGRARDVAWLLNHFTGSVCAEKVKAKKLAPRTAKDYLHDAAVLIKGLGKIPVVSLAPAHIATFCNTRAVAAPTHVRNEMGCLSAALTWAVEANIITVNPAREVKRPGKRVRERLITDDEYLAAYAKAPGSVQLAMVLAVRTLGLPADVLRMGRANVVRYDDGRRTLRFRRGKTNQPVEVEIVGELAAALEPLLDPPTLHPTFVRREDGKPYTVDGIGAMFRRAVTAAGIVMKGDDGKEHVDFGLRDLRAKGATDMFRAGVPIRHIQLLLGHSSVRTTEIYLKDLLAEIVRPNETPIIARVK